jgi:hypothetical protein
MMFQRVYFERILGGGSSDGPFDSTTSQPMEQVYPIGTKFEKEFEGYDRPFVGEIKIFDGHYYHVLYDDNDEEMLSETELNSLKIITEVPQRRVQKQEVVHCQTQEETAEEEAQAMTTTSNAITIDDNEGDTGKKLISKEPQWPIGTKFLKVFEGYGTFVGEIQSFDGMYYHMIYPSDGDEEDLTEEEVRRLMIVPTEQESSEAPSSSSAVVPSLSSDTNVYSTDAPASS